MDIIGGTKCLKCKKGTYHLINLIIIRRMTINDKSNKKLSYKCDKCGDIINKPYLVDDSKIQIKFKDIE